MTPRAAWIAVVIAAAFYLFEFVARLEPSLATREIAGHFGLSEGGFSTLASLFFWIYAPMQLVVGLVLDRYGARPFILLGLGASALGVLVFALAQGPVLGGLGRLTTGFGASFAFVGALYLVNHWFAPSRFALLSGVVNAIGMIGTAAGSILISEFIQTAGWRPVFLATAAGGGLVFLAALFFLRDAPGAPKPTAKPIAPHARAQLGAVLRDRRSWLIGVLGMLYYVPINVFGVLWGHDALISRNGLTSVEAQAAISMLFWGAAVGSVVFGAVSDVIGHRKWLIFGGALATAIAFSTLLYAPLSSLVAIGFLLFFCGFCAGGQMLTFAAAKEARAAEQTGVIVALVNMVGIGGAILFQPLTGALLELFDKDFAKALTIAPIALIGAALLTLMLREERHADHMD